MLSHVQVVKTMYEAFGWSGGYKATGKLGAGYRLEATQPS